MDRRNTSYMVLYQFAPLLIFVLVDLMYGERAGIITALGVSLLQLACEYMRRGSIRKALLFDFGLLLLMGSISLYLRDPLFILLKPAIIEGILSIIIFGSIMIGDKRLRSLVEIHVGGEIDLNKSRRVLKYFSAGLIIHGAGTAAAALCGWKRLWSVWNFTPYLVIIVLILIRFKKGRVDELLPVCDANGVIRGKTARSNAHGGSMLLHPVVHLHLYKPGKGLLLQKRGARKLIQPGRWDSSVGGHVAWGEDINRALKRECDEEIGFFPGNATFLRRYIWETGIERELVYSFISVHTGDFSIPLHFEGDELRFWDIDEIKGRICEDNLFTDNLKFEFREYLVDKVF